MINILKEIKIILRTHGKGIKSFFSQDTVTSSVPTGLPENGDTITNLYYIANTFNNYLVSVVEITKKALNTHIKMFQI